MDRATSVYLDAVRLLAACVVVVFHAFGARITGGFLWPVGQYGPTAVMVFFVLSGYVVRHVVERQEHTFGAYAVARLSRLYSMVLPALLLTAVCNLLGQHLLPADSVPWAESGGDAALGYVASALMLQDVWTLERMPPNNGSFWSLSYEFFYYALFAVMVWARGVRRWLLGAAVALVAGPAILSLLPVWLAGGVAWRLHQGPARRLPWAGAAALAVGGAALLALGPWHRAALSIDVPGLEASLPSDLLDGLAFFLHLLGMPTLLSRAAPWLERVRPAVAGAASLTFALYLFHLPVLRLVTGLSPFVAAPGSAAHITWVYGLTGLVVVALGLPAERARPAWRRVLARGWEQLARTGGRDALRLPEPPVKA